MVLEGSKISFRIRIPSLIHQFCDDFPFDIKGTGSDIPVLIEHLIEVFFVLAEISDTGKVDGDNTDRAGRFTGTEVSATFLSQFTEVKTQTAAPRTDITRLPVGIDVIGEIRGSVFCSPLEEKTVVFTVRPIEVLGDGVGRNRILEATSVGISFDPDFDKGFVDPVPFFLAVSVGEVPVLSTDNGRNIFPVIRNGPIEGDVAERSLGSPARRSIHAINKGLNTLFDFFVGQIIYFDKWSKVGIKRRKCLSSCPFVLPDS